MEDKYEEGTKKGMDLGREEGYTVAKEGFDYIVESMKAKEASKARTLVENGVDTRLAPTAAISTQTSTIIITAPLTMSIVTQTDSLDHTCGSGPLLCMAFTSLNLLSTFFSKKNIKLYIH